MRWPGDEAVSLGQVYSRRRVHGDLSPGGPEGPEHLGDKARSRAYPGIKVHKGKFVFSSPELEIQRFGLGTQPFVFVTGLEVEEEGQEVDLSQVNWLQSMAIKKVVCNTLGESVMPNWHNKAGRWREATQKAKFSKLMPPAVWPAPIEEDDLRRSRRRALLSLKVGD